MMFVVLVLLSILAQSAALTCFETDESTGEIKEVTNDEWKYCVFIPQSNQLITRVFGVGPEEDSTYVYENSFKQQDNFYKVLTVCIYEKFDLRPLSPRFAGPEFLFRCMCNYDRCNSHQTFSGFLAGVERDNRD
ncbi:unnamed protein product [Auanema sp. JU1783]|nr:unnamed protein product [Auanema sp. JU1783]